MPVLLRNTPQGYDWGFYSREEPRMHLQTMRGAPAAYKLWLEHQGSRVIEKAGEIPAKIFNAVKSALETDDMLAWRVRAEWVHQMLVKGWLRLHLEGTCAVITAYPDTPHQFQRRVQLADHARPSLFVDPPQDVRFDDETASLMIGARHPEYQRVLVDLAEILWR